MVGALDAFLPVTDKPPFGPELLPQPSLDVQPARPPSFLDDALEQFAGATGGGRPTTKQGEEFILNFMDRFGEAPTSQQLSSFKRGLGTDFDFTNLPGSTQAQLGFASTQALIDARLAAGGPGVEHVFGPRVGGEGFGGLVPRGGIVITDPQGTPLFTTFEPEKFQAQIARGEFIQPTGGELFDIEQLFEPQGAVPQGFQEPVAGQFLRPPQAQFERPSLEEGIKSFGPVVEYQARLEDYITEQQRIALPQLQSIQGEYDAEVETLTALATSGEIDKTEFNIRLAAIDKTFLDRVEQSGLMTKDKAIQIRTEAEAGVGRGLSAEELPFFAESRETTGAKIGELLKRGTGLLEQQFQQAQPPAFVPPQEAPLQTGTEQSDYFTLIEGLGLAPEVQQFMMGRYQEFLFQWLKTGPTMTFVDWIQQQIRGG